MAANPYRVLYLNPSLPVIKFAKMAEKYHNERDMMMLQKCAQLTGHVLVPSSELNWRQRKKNQHATFRIGYQVFYLLSPGEAKNIKTPKGGDECVL